MRMKRKPRVGRKFATLLVVPITASAWIGMNGCGDSSFTSGSSDAGADVTTTDVSNGSDATSDTFVPPADAGVCDLTAPFDPPSPITSLNVAKEFDQTARLTHDELVIYFQAVMDAGPAAMLVDGGPAPSDAGPFQLFTATRSILGDDNWGPRSLLPASINGMGTETDPSIADSNQTLYFTSSAGLVDNIWRATRDSGADFTTAANIMFSISPFTAASQPYALADGSIIYLRAFGASTSRLGLYRATRNADGTFSVDTTGFLDDLNTNVDQISLPVVTTDELTIYFTSGTGGSRVLQKATRNNTTERFTNYGEVDELNNSSINEASWISDDGCRLYLSSNSDGTTHLYVAKKPAKN